MATLVVQSQCKQLGQDSFAESTLIRHCMTLSFGLLTSMFRNYSNLLNNIKPLFVITKFHETLIKDVDGKKAQQAVD